MVQIIGLMIGFYIIVRMLSFATREGDRAENTLVKIVASIVLIITAFLIVGLLATGSTTLPNNY